MTKYSRFDLFYRTELSDLELLRNYESNLEDKIYCLFRRNWIVTNDGKNASIALPFNQQFVYIFENHQLKQACSEDSFISVLDELCKDTYEYDLMTERLALSSLSPADNLHTLVTSKYDDALANHLLSRFQIFFENQNNDVATSYSLL